MKTTRIVPTLTALVLFSSAFSSSTLKAENWPQWRGPAFNGTSPESNLPDKFSKTDALWATPMPGQSASTPIVWEDKIFLSTSDDKTKDLIAMCVNRKDGKILWQKKISVWVPKASPTGKNTMASPSAVTDGKHVWFSFGTGDIVAFDVAGNQVWAKNLQKDYGAFSYMHGYSSSPLLYKDKLIIPVLRRDKIVVKGAPAATGDASLDSFLLAVEPATGKEIWKRARKGEAKDGAQEAYTTPIPFENGGRSEILMAGADTLSSHDPNTGEEIWRWNGVLNPENSRTVVSAVPADSVILTAGAQRMPVYALKTGAKGVVEKNDVAWKITEYTANVCTPLYYNGLVYLLDGAKRFMTCVDPRTGEKKWQGALGGTSNFSGSPTGADGRIYCLSESGDVIILSAGGSEFKILANIPLEEAGSYSSISVAHGQLFVRTGKNLYCFGKK